MPSGVYKHHHLKKGFQKNPNQGFRKGHITWNKNKTNIYSEIIRKNISLFHTGKWKGEKNYTWKGDKAKYGSIHHWLVNNFGKANQCEHCKKMAEDYKTAKGLQSKRHPIQYALIKGKKYSHNRENYICLCYLCHKKYDASPRRENVSAQSQ